ncbi:MAG TPA: amidohydrolase [Bacteroidales bacterium]|nr:amidohydrolase [Bacteroidales bacterium]
MPFVVDKNLEQKLVDLRKTLHRHPELSGKELQTSSRLKKFLREFPPDEIIEQVGGHGLIALFKSGLPGPSILLRCDMDALPIHETNNFDHRSENEGVAHKCGHDGHMAIMAGVSAMLSKQKPAMGSVSLLFQPEEENGRGAEKVLSDAFFETFKPELVFAMHNLPGFAENLVVSKQGCFASASRGLIIRLHGSTSHAAYPELGRSPVRVVGGLLESLTNLPLKKATFEDYCLVTIIHARIGERAFGTTPEEAVVMATLRSNLDKDMARLTFEAEELVKGLCHLYGIAYELEYTEVYPATMNDSKAFELVKNAALKSQVEFQEIQHPFRWSEDFGRFTSKYPGAVFGLGVGIDHPGLHSNSYDFNDNVIRTGIKVFLNIVNLKNGLLN